MPTERITIQDLGDSLDSGNFSDEHLIKSVLRNRDLVNQSKFWDLPFSEQQWSLLFQRLNPYILLVAFFSKDAHSKSGLMELFYKLEPQIFQQVFSLHVHLRCKGFKAWLEVAECDTSFKADMIRIWELQVQLQDSKNQLLRFLENYDSSQVLKSLSFFQYANQDSKKIWGNNRAIGHFFENWSSQIIYDYLNKIEKMDLEQFIKSNDNRHNWSLLHHGVYSMAYRSRDTELTKDEEIAEQLFLHFKECFKKEAETMTLQVKRFYGLSEITDYTTELIRQKLIRKTRVISYLEKAGITEISDISFALSAIKQGDNRSFIANHIQLEKEGLPKDLDIDGKEFHLSLVASLLDSISIAGYKKTSLSPFPNFDIAFDQLIRAAQEILQLNGNSMICQIETSGLQMLSERSGIEFSGGFDGFLNFIATDIPSLKKIDKDFLGFMRLPGKPDSVYMLPAITSKIDWIAQILLFLSKEFPQNFRKKLGTIREEYVAGILQECGLEVFKGIYLKSTTGEFGEIDVLAKCKSTWLLVEVKGIINAGIGLDWPRKEMVRIHAEASFQLKRIQSMLQSDYTSIQFSSENEPAISFEKPDRIVSVIVTNLDVVEQRTLAKNSFISLSLLQLLCCRQYQESFTTALQLEKNLSLSNEYDNIFENLRQNPEKVIDAIENLSFWEPLVKIGTGID